MKLIIGLGNPGKEYTCTRHNVGFLMAEYLRSQWSFPDFSLNKKFSAEISEGLLGPEKLRLGVNEKIILVKPNTFMNLSGVAVRALLDFYKLSPADIFVIQDELDIPFGTYRLAIDSSAAGHNGIKNIIEHLGTQTFTRLRIGLSQRKPDEPCPYKNFAHDFVLDRFTPEEETALETLFPTLEQEVKKFIEQE
ncbi:MAG: aminoacyl-tRNA hydrolase [Candidatus Moraniibacteriota bacterium]